MGTIMRYEFRRNWSYILGIVLAAVGLEAGLLVTWFMESDYISLFASGLSFLMIFTVVFIFINGIKLFSDDLNKKEGYMLFMTPNSAYKIMGAKLLSVICIATGLALLLGGIFFIDGFIMSDENTVANIRLFFDTLHAEYGVDMKTALGLMGLFVLYGYLGLVTIVVFGYLAITLSATLFQNLKYKGVFTVIIFFAMLVLVSWFESRFGWGNISMEETLTIQDFIIRQIPSTIFEFVCCFAAFLGSGYLLDKKISL